MHLRMTGNLLLDAEDGGARASPPAGGDPPRGRAGACCSPTRGGSGRRWCSTTAALDEYFAARLGIEPLSEALTAEELCRLAAGRRAPLKSFLLNQLGIAGIGNIYADEALHRAELHPLSPAGSMKPEDCERLREGIVETLEAGLRSGGASIDDYRDARGERGTMQDEFLVHTREGEPCPRCGAEIRRIVVAGRSTYFCPSCQRRLRRRPPAAPRRDAQGDRVSEPIRPARGLRDRALDRRRGRDGLQRGDPAAREPGRRGRPRRRAGHARDRRDRPARRHQRGDGGAAHRRQRLRPGGGRRGDALARGARAWATRPRPGWCRSSPRPSSTTSRRAIRGRARGPMPATRPASPRRRAFRSAGRVGAGTGAAVGKILGRERSTPAGIGYAAARSGRGETVAALAVVNAFGDVIGEDGRVLAGPRGEDGEALSTAERDRGDGGAARLDEARGAQHDARLRDDRRGARQGGLRARGADGERRRRPRGGPRLLGRRRRRRLLPRRRAAAPPTASRRSRSARSPRRSPRRRSATRSIRDLAGAAPRPA